MANTYQAFKGILQYKSTDTFTKQAGYIYFVREFKDGKETGNAEVFFGTRKYGDFNTTGLADLQGQITANANNITAINNILGQWSEKFQGDISTLANAVVAVSGATTTNTSAIATLNGDAETAGSVAKAVADAKSELLGDAADDYNTLGKLEDKIQAVEAAAKSYEIKAITTGLSANVKEAFGLFDEEGVQTGATINIYKDSSLKEVKLSGQSLQFTYILADGTESTVGVDVSTFLSEAEFKNGLQVVDHVVSVKKDASSEDFLSVSTNGIKLSGVQDAINAGVESANGYTDAAITAETKAREEALTTLESTLKGYADQAETDAIATATAYTENAKTELRNDLTAYTATTKTTLDTLRSDIDTISGTVANNSTAITNLQTTKLDATTYESYTASTSSVLESIKSGLSAITKNAVTRVASSAKTITVTENGDGGVNVEVNTLAHAESGQDGYVILNNVDGALYGVMYYGGDDAE